MQTKHIRLRRLVEGCALVAFPKWQRTGVKVTNHALDIDGHHHEWLSIIRPDGGLRFWQHYPDFRSIGVLRSQEVTRLVNPPTSRFTSRAIRGHIRNETRRRR